MSMLCAFLLATQPVAGDVNTVGWLSGAWHERAANGEWFEEYWTPVRGQVMIGAGLSGRGDALKHFEHMRIERTADGRVDFIAMPDGAAPTRFALVRQTADEVVFENAGHDYPQRVRYRREGDKVVGEISRLDGSDERRWVMSRR